MKPILQNLVEMTGHRDHLRLEVSVLSTLQKLSSITEVRALELFTDSGVPYVRPRTWVDNGQLVSTDSEAAADPRREPLDNYPALRGCVLALRAMEHGELLPEGMVRVGVSDADSLILRLDPHLDVLEARFAPQDQGGQLPLFRAVRVR